MESRCWLSGCGFLHFPVHQCQHTFHELVYTPLSIPLSISEGWCVLLLGLTLLHLFATTILAGSFGLGAEPGIYCPELWGTRTMAAWGGVNTPMVGFTLIAMDLLLHVGRRDPDPYFLSHCPRIPSFPSLLTPDPQPFSGVVDLSRM